MIVAVATSNPVKARAVEEVFEETFPNANIAVRAVSVDLAIPEQPIGPEVEAGAIARARAAGASEAADYGVGIEAGLVRLDNDARWFSVQVCAIADRAGRLHVGLGPGYELPADIQDAVLAGEPLRDAFRRLLGVDDADRRGAIYHLSEGQLDRLDLTRFAIRMALVRCAAGGVRPANTEG